MKIKLKVDLGDGTEPIFVKTTAFCIAEWEKENNRRISDGRGFGVIDMAWWAHFLLKRSDTKVPATSREWMEENPELEISSDGDETNPNPTSAATTDGN